MDRALEARKKWRPTWLIASASAAVFFCALVIFWPSSNEAKASYLVTAATRYPELQGRAVLEPAHVTVISAQSEGVVGSLKGTIGAPVTKGTVLAVLVNPTLSAELRQAQLTFNNAEASARISGAELQEALLDRETAASERESALRTAQAELEAYTRLYDKGGVSRLALAKVQAETEQAATEKRFAFQKLAQFRATIRSHGIASHSEVEIARESLQELQQAYEALTIAATQDGVISKLDMKIGQKISPGEAIGEIISTDLIADIGIPQDTASALEIGQEVSFSAPQGAFRGRVVSILPRAVDGVVHAKAQLLSAPSWLRSDLVCEATIKGRQAINGLFVLAPVGVLANSTNEMRVTGVDGGVRSATVQFGSRFGSDLQIKSGLKAGERISVVDGQ